MQTIRDLTIVNWNKRSTSSSSLGFLDQVISDIKPDIISLQETRNHRLWFDDYSCYTTNTKLSDGQHGSCILVRKNLSTVLVLEALPLSVDIHLIDLGIKIANVYISSQFQKYKKVLELKLQERLQDPSYIITGDLNYMHYVVPQTFAITRIDKNSSSAIDFIHSNSLDQLSQQTIHSTSDHLMLIKKYRLDCYLNIEERVSKIKVNKVLTLEDTWYGGKKVKPRPAKKQFMSSFLTAANHIKRLWANKQLKEANKMISKRIGIKQGIIVQGVKDMNKSESLIEVPRHINLTSIGQHYPRITNKPIHESHLQDQFSMGTVYWQYTFQHRLYSDILRNSPTDKALGPDNVSDQFLRKNLNALPMMDYIQGWINGSVQPPEWINDSNLMLLSKDDTCTPPLNKTRPIAMSSALRKMLESAWMRLYAPFLWSTILPQQIGFRPGKQMGENTAQLLLDIQTNEFESIWFIDIAQAFPSPPMSLIMDEVNRRRLMAKKMGWTMWDHNPYSTFNLNNYQKQQQNPSMEDY